MGQQQLLLIVAAVLIVGLALVGGFTLFNSSTQQANQDAIAHDLMTIVSLSQTWCAKPVLIGGGGGSFSGFTLDKISWQKNATTGKFENDNGTFAVSGTPSARELSIGATAKNGKTIVATLSVDDKGKVNVVLSGV